MESSSTNSTHFDKSNIKEMMKYNLNNLFKDPNIFEWPPIVYEELQNNGWNHLTEAVVGSKFSSIRPFFNDRKIKHQQRLSLLKSQRREGIRLKHGVIDNKLMLNSCFDKVLSSPTKQKKRKAKRRSHKFDPSSLETAKARQNRFSIAALKEKFMEQIAANRLNSSKRSSVSTVYNSKRSTRRGLSCKISTNSYYPNLQNSLHIYTQSGHNNSCLLTEKKQGNIGVDNKAEDTTCNSSDKNYQKSTSGSFRPTRLKFLTNESVKLYKKEFIKSLRKAPTQKTEKSEAFQIGHQFGQFHTSKIRWKPKLNSSTYYESYATPKKRVLSPVSQ
ncbi:unnamed protein product [Moneuplotes crassus]|uniref:Uncharacterized protein n=1 Tax=Euplotes crassus TaxID=5936 RepID=A0AAD1UE00_EUPCR|nr:unnamed protein product [Moneuplotes crassus]